MKLCAEDKNFLRLIQRSPDIGEGWRNVSPQLWTLVEERLKTIPALIEAELEPTGGGRVRLTEEAQIVMKYL